MLVFGVPAARPAHRSKAQGEGGVRAFTRVHAAAQRHASYAYKQYLPYQLSDGVAEACCVCVARPQLRRTRHGAPYVALRLHARAACPPR